MSYRDKKAALSFGMDKIYDVKRVQLAYDVKWSMEFLGKLATRLYKAMNLK